jgi:DNA-binding NtrC family response regulator
MPGLRSWWRRVRGRPAAARAAAAIEVLAITGDAAQREALARIAQECGWRLHLAASSGEAESALTARGGAVVIFDRDLPGEDWRVVLPRLARLPQAGCVLLASRVADEYLWQEVIRHHGHDVLPKPFQPGAVARIVSCAWSWRGGEASAADRS